MWRTAALIVVLTAVAAAGCSLEGHSAAAPGAPAAPVASPAKLRLLQQSFAGHQLFRRAASVSAVSKLLPIVRIRPHAKPASVSDASIDSVWLGNPMPSGARDATIIWKSGIVETLERWSCNCEAATSLRQMGHMKPFRFFTLRGAPAITAPSDPNANTAFRTGFVAPADFKYGIPASVETIRDGYRVTLWQYGPDAQAGLLAAARTLPAEHLGLRVGTHEIGGAALGDGHGPKGITVLPRGGARFGVGVALQNISGRPLTITGVKIIDGFIRLIGVEFRPYTPPSGSLLTAPFVHRPYAATPPLLHHTLQPGAWAGVQLDYQIMSPCVPWSSTIYEPTAEVTYTQPGWAGRIQDVRMIQLNITRHHHC
jgi:hypothetical protein